MPTPTVKIKLGSWFVSVYDKQAISWVMWPRVPANYVVSRGEESYVGQSGNVFLRIYQHIQGCICNTATVISSAGAEDDRILRIHIEFGLMLIQLGCDKKLSSKQADIPAGGPDEKHRALDFFETVALHFEKVAPHIFGSGSDENRRAMDAGLSYLRMIWGGPAKLR